MSCTSYLISQFGHPRGFLGSWVGMAMAVKNQPRNDWAIELLNVESSNRLLEIGFGSGVAIQKLSDLIPEGAIAGIDRSEVMLKQASRRNAKAIRQGRVALKCGSVEHLPYEDNYFDKAFASNSHFFWSNPVENLKEVRRVLKPGGLILLCWQPRWAKTEEAVQKSAQNTYKHLQEAEFEQIELTFKPMKPVTAIGAIAFKSRLSVTRESKKSRN